VKTTSCSRAASRLNDFLFLWRLLSALLLAAGGGSAIAAAAQPLVEVAAFGAAPVSGAEASSGPISRTGDLLLRPRGRTDTTEQLQLHGIRLGAAAEDGTLLGTPWAIADATTQPGIINAVTDADGKASLHVGIGWPTTAAAAPTGGLAIDRIVFTSSALPGGQLDLGASRIGTMQIQYLDVKLRPGL